MRKNNIILEQVQIEYRFDFIIEEKDWDLIIKPVKQLFLNAEIIDNSNKKILPKDILKYLSFKNNERYMITVHNISYYYSKIGIYWKFRLKRNL